MTQIEQFKLNGQLPSPKGAALAIMEIVGRENARADEIARVLQTDPALAGRLLRMANSAAYGDRPIASIAEAVMRLGLVAVRQLAVGFSLVDQYRSGACPAFNYQRFWSHSLMMGVAMQELGSVTRVASADELFACGLMARIGCLALPTVYPREYAALLNRDPSDADLAPLERQVLGLDHNECTDYILTDCGIPKSLTEPIFYHEAPETSGFGEGSRPYQLVHLLYHAKRLADLGLAPQAERSAIVSELMLLGGKIGLNTQDVGNLVDRIGVGWSEWGKLLEVPVNGLPPFAKMLETHPPRSGKAPTADSVRVLVAVDDPTERQLLETVLGELFGQKVYSAGNGQEALILALEIMPQIVLVDQRMPVLDGLAFCRSLRSTDWGQSIYLVMLTSLETQDEVIEAFDAGADDYVTKPFIARTMRARMRAAMHYVKLLGAWEQDRAQLKQFSAELAISNRKLEHYALTDLLTGLPNRRAGMNALAQAWSAANRTGQQVAVMMIDVDHFKTVNDAHGHAAGDKALIAVAEAIRDSARKDDSVCRFGGEEFLVICHHADQNSTLRAAERLRQTVKALRIGAGAVEIQTAVSIGVACKESRMLEADALVNAADKALYAAKAGGRDRICLIVEGKIHHPLNPFGADPGI